MPTKWSGEQERISYVKKMADITRYDLVAMLSFSGSGHPGGSLSVVEIMCALYYGEVMRYEPGNATLRDRDRFIMSKGHASPTLYVILADLGYFPIEWLRIFDANGSSLPKHCDRLKTPGVEASTGALGQGISMAVGFALAQRIDKIPYDVFCVIGDGECQSGNTMEAAMSAGGFRLGNLKVILDLNDLQIDGRVSEIMPLGDIKGMWSALGWNVISCGGHDVPALLSALDEMKSRDDKPQLLIAETVKGKGVSFMEHNADWHSEKITKELAVKALADVARPLDKTIPRARFLSAEELRELCGNR
jgi:transketolase